jgi:prepilin-type N-terminal cleavage/methylation domain-containing protein/prepilin-type processing-associated H-X9-DG protein
MNYAMFSKTESGIGLPHSKTLRRSLGARGFTLIELLVVIACLGILAALVLSGVARANARSSKINCVNNLKQIGVAFLTWSLDNSTQYPMQVSVTNGGTMELVDSGVVYRHFQVMSNELSTPKILVCPYDSARSTSSTFASTIPAGSANSTPFTNDANVSYFVGVDVSPGFPSMFLTGDGNVGLEGMVPKSGLQAFAKNSKVGWFGSRHHNKGNIGFADGSVQTLDSKELRKALTASGVTNRLAIPASP